MFRIDGSAVGAGLLLGGEWRYQAIRWALVGGAITALGLIPYLTWQL